MKLLEQLSLAIRTAANSVLAPKPGAPGPSTASLISSAQKRLDALNGHLAKAIEREKRAEHEWQQVLSESTTLDLEAQVAAQTAADETAKLAALAKQNQARQLHDKARQLEDAYHEAASFTEKLRIQIGDTQAQLDRARKLAGQPVPPLAPAAAAQAPVQQPASQDQAKAKETSQPAAPPASTDEPLDETRIADILSKRKD